MGGGGFSKRLAGFFLFKKKGKLKKLYLGDGLFFIKKGRFSKRVIFGGLFF